MVQWSPLLVCPVADVSSDQFLEMRELAFGDENSGQHLTIALAYVHQLNALFVPRKARSRQRDRLFALEFDLNADCALHIDRMHFGYALLLEGLPLRFYCILTLGFVLANAWSGRDFGPMRPPWPRRGWEAAPRPF